MRVTVTIDAVAREQLLRLIAGRHPDPADALRFAILYGEEIVRVFEQHQSPPPGAILRPGSGRRSWWLFANGIWLAFTTEDRSTGRFPFRRQERVFRIVAFADQPAVA